MTNVADLNDAQARGVQHLSAATTHMEAITQSTAASASQFVSSTGQIADSTREINHMVQILQGIVGGTSADPGLGVHHSRPARLSLSAGRQGSSAQGFFRKIRSLFRLLRLLPRLRKE
jgi:hypothetical protein